MTIAKRIVSVFKDDKNSLKFFIVNKLKNGWILVGNKDDEITQKTKLEDKISNICRSKRHQIRLKQNKCLSL